MAVVAVAYGSQAPSLGVAEFAPAARQTLEPPPTTAGDGSSSGQGGGRRRSASASTTAPVGAADGAVGSTAPTTRVGRSRSCVGDPPRQTEDPQSPACRNTVFEGDNGGATSMGVTGTEIKVAVQDRSNMNASVQLLFDYFNLRFEMYGRRLVPVFVPYNIGDPVSQRATADDIASRQVFAAFDTHVGATTPMVAFHQALARGKVVSTVVREMTYSDAVLYDQNHPYVWGVHPSIETIWRAVAELTCGSLAGRPASHAGATLASTTRKFGVIAETNFSGGTVPLGASQQQLVRMLDACGVNPEVREIRSLTTETDGRTAVAAMEAAGVTSIICACYHGMYYLATNLAQGSGYTPELLLPNLIFSVEAVERDLQGASVRPYAEHVFGVYQQPKALPYQVRPFFTAMRSMDPVFNPVVAGGGAGNFRSLEGVYRQLLLLASGVQGAGPTLTPDTFAQSMMTLEFPNPGAGQAPFWQPRVGFGPGDHTFHDDVALAWWSSTLPATSVEVDGRPGSWCFLGGGTRFGAGQIPTDADQRFFDANQPCR